MARPQLICLATILLAALLAPSLLVFGQTCVCASGLYCGCASGLYHAGPCYSPSGSGGGGGSSSVSDIVTDDFFNGIIGWISASCPGNNFYSRQAFLDVAGGYPQFGTTGSDDDKKREIAAFFGHVTHETGYFCFIEAINRTVDCDRSNTQWPCNPSKAYYGRGPLQISWNSNYGPAGQSIGFDGLNSPETVANDPIISFKTAFWFWMNNVHSIITSGQGFGATIRAIKNSECNGGNSGAVQQRVDYYTNYCGQLGIDPGDNLSC